MTIEYAFCLGLVALACCVLISGFPVAFALGGSALIVGTIGYVCGVFDMSFIHLMPERIFTIMSNEVLIAVPLFVFMGVVLEKSRVAEELLQNMGYLFGKLRGGLAISVTIVGALMAASTGIIGATVVTMGLLSLPTMLRHGYDAKFSCGTICASGTLGQIIPPSIVLVLLGDVIGTSWQEAQSEMGIFATSPVSVGDLFAGALIPGLMLVVLYIAYQIFVALFKPQHAPALQPDPEFAQMSGREIYLKIAGSLAPPIILIVAVLGSILSGIAPPTEAASVGAVGALLLSGVKQCGRRGRGLVLLAIGSVVLLLGMAFLFDLKSADANGLLVSLAFLLCWFIVLGIGRSIIRLYQDKVLSDTIRQTTQITSMVFAILIGAAVFSLVFRGFGGDEAVQVMLDHLPGGLTGAMIAVMALMFVLGFFLDFLEITFVVVPLVAPILMVMGADPVWLGVMIALNLQTSFLTPPFGFALFYLRGVAPEGITSAHIYKGILPYVGIQVLALAIVAFFPTLATWLPRIIFG